MVCMNINKNKNKIKIKDYLVNKLFFILNRCLLIQRTGTYRHPRASLGGCLSSAAPGVQYHADSHTSSCETRIAATQI